MPPSSPLCDHDSTQSIRQESSLVWGGDLRPHPGTKRAPCPSWRTLGPGLLGPLVTGETLNHAPQCPQNPLSCCFPAVSERPTGCPHPPASISPPPGEGERSIPFPKHHFGGAAAGDTNVCLNSQLLEDQISPKKKAVSTGGCPINPPTHPPSVNVFSRTCSSRCSGSHRLQPL